MEIKAPSRKFPREIINLCFLSFISIILSIQILIIATWISSRIPLKSDYGSLYEIYREKVHPERDAFLYRFFVITVLAIQSAAVGIYRRRLAHPDLGNKLRRFLGAEVLLLLLICFAAFKMVVYDSPRLAVYLFYALIGAAVMMKIFWRWLDAFLVRAAAWLDNFSGSIRLTRTVDLIIPVCIFAMLFIPNVSGVVARIFLQDGFHHMDYFVMAPGWAAIKGCALSVDTASEYGLGMPVLLGRLSKILGGFTYENILRLLVLMAIMYYMVTYLFLRLWLRDVCVAAVGVLWAIHCTMFSHGPVLMAWQFPQSTVVRYFFDMIFFICILRHLRTQKGIYIILAGAVSGAGLYYINDTGLCLAVAFYAYGFLLLLLGQARSLVYKSPRDILFATLCFILPALVYFVLIFSAVGSQIFSAMFWHNVGERIQQVSHGVDAIAVLDNLKNKNFLYFFMGYVVALTYLFSLVFIVSLNWLKKIDREHVIVAVLCVYGLGLYHYYIGRSAPSNFFVVGVPWVLVLCFWMCHLKNYLPRPAQNRTCLVLVSMTLFGLLSTHSFLQYPHFLNLAGKTYEQDKADMAEAFISEQDISLIKRLTRPDEKVCLISSYETATLMAADRKPFFYSFLMVHSRPMKIRGFGGWALLTQEQFNRMMTTLSEENPEYVFIESKLIAGTLPNIYYQHYRTLKTCVDYLREYYKPVEVGKYLVAMKRK